MISNQSKAHQSKIIAGTSRRLYLELLEDRAAPGDLMGLGLTQAAMAPTGARGGVASVAKPLTVKAPYLNSSLFSSASRPSTAAASPSFGSQSPIPQPSLAQTQPGAATFSFPQQLVEGFPESRPTFSPTPQSAPAYSVMGAFAPPVSMPNIGNPVVITPPNGATPIGSPVTPPSVIVPPPGAAAAVSFTGITPDTGSSSADAVTTAQKPSILGKATPGSLVSITANGVTLGTGTANIVGHFSIPISQPLSNGAHALAITANKPGMDPGFARATVTVDTIAPRITLAAPASVTNGSAPVITATSSEGGMISIDIDLNLDGKYAGSELAFATAASGRPLALSGLRQQGNLSIRARQSDIAGNVGAAESSTVIDPFAGFVGDSQLKTMLKPALEELGIAGKWNGRALTVPGNYQPTDPKMLEKVVVSVRCVSPREFDAFKLSVVGLGMNVAASDKRDLLLDGTIPLYQVLRLPSIPGFSSASLVEKGITRAGTVDNKGVPVMRIPQFTQQTGATGAGVTIGVISDSANAVAPGLSGSINSGDLPANTTILFDDPSGIDEGRAMMEVAYDAAPGASFAFSSRGPSPLTFANSITNLADFGCEVITDDIVFFNQPLFNDGRVNQAAQRVVDRGVVYTSAFGNIADQAWQGNWKGKTATVGLAGFSSTGTFMDFGGGDYLQNITIPTGGFLNLVFQWDAAYLEGGSTLPNYQVPNDLDAFLINLTTGQIVAFGLNINQNTDQALERIVFLNTGATTSFALAFELFSGPAPTRLAWLNYGDDVQAQGQGAPSTQGTPTVAGVISVAAANARTPQVPESFTSLGGELPIFFDTFTGARLATPQIRQKPDLTAPDAINTTLSPNSGLNPFFGTSCAAPQAAAAAALLLSSRPSTSNNQIFFHLMSTAGKIFPVGIENYVGAGMTTVVPLPATLPPDPSGDPLFPTMVGNIGQTATTLRNQSISNIGTTPDVDWFAFRPSRNGTVNVSMLNGPGGSLEMRLYTLGTFVNMVERARSNKQGLTFRNLSITVSANQLVYIKVNGRTSSPGIIDQAMYQLTLNMS